MCFFNKAIRKKNAVLNLSETPFVSDQVNLDQLNKDSLHIKCLKA